VLPISLNRTCFAQVLFDLNLPKPHMFSSLKTKIRAWWWSRLTPADNLRLAQRNLYILPTRPGWMFALTLLVLLLISINYQLNLGYALTFLLAGCGVVSMHVTHNNLRGLTLHLKPVTPVFAGQPAMLEVVLTNAGHARFGVGLKLSGAQAQTLVWSDVPAGGQAHVRLGFVPPQRGWHEAPPLTIETRFPLGFFRVWSLWKPAARLLAYPTPETPASPLPVLSSPVAALTPPAATVSRAADGGESDGVRAYRRGDPIRQMVWKKSAKAMASGGELVSRDTRVIAQRLLWLDWQLTPDARVLSSEERLSRLCAWVLSADRADVEYGLRLPPQLEIEPGDGETHRLRCLEALAVWS
jgi:uncharacterized protein (DUF58 family)